MSRSTANVSFYCRESKKNKDGLAPIEMVIILNTRRCFIQLPRKEYPSQFKAQIRGASESGVNASLCQGESGEEAGGGQSDQGGIRLVLVPDTLLGILSFHSYPGPLIS